MHRTRRPARLAIASAAVVGVSVVVGCSPAARTHPAAAGRAPASLGGWGIAERVPGSATLNKGGNADLESVSCASAGNCGAAGDYTDASGQQQPFVVSEVSGTWQNAERVPGTATLNKGGNAAIDSLSCASAGNCGAAGDYTDGSGHYQALVVSQVNGTWQQAEEVPGTAALNTGGDADLGSVSCASAGNCSAAGSYTDASGHGQAFVVNEINGTWQSAQQVPGTATFNGGALTQISSLSCASAGNCSAGLNYQYSSDLYQAFVVSEINGTWQSAEQVPGLATLNMGRDAGITSVSCVSAGNCTAGGNYTDGSGNYLAFVVSEINGTWQGAQQVPGTATLNKGKLAQISSLACASAGNCSAVGEYTGASFLDQVFAVSEINGVWQQAEQIPGIAILNKGDAQIFSVSCASAGNCSAVGTYIPGSIYYQAFVVSQINGTWQQPEQVPGTAALDKGRDAEMASVSCVPVDNCSAVGWYRDRSGHTDVIVVSKT
jgi:hypothetical protein